MVLFAGICVLTVKSTIMEYIIHEFSAAAIEESADIAEKTVVSDTDIL